MNRLVRARLGHRRPRGLPTVAIQDHIEAVVARTDESDRAIGTPRQTGVAVVAGGERHRLTAVGIDQVDVLAAIVQPAEVVEAISGTGDAMRAALALLVGDRDRGTRIDHGEAASIGTPFRL